MFVCNSEHTQRKKTHRTTGLKNKQPKVFIIFVLSGTQEHISQVKGHSAALGHGSQRVWDQGWVGAGDRVRHTHTHTQLTTNQYQSF